MDNASVALLKTKKLERVRQALAARSANYALRAWRRCYCVLLQKVRSRLVSVLVCSLSLEAILASRATVIRCIARVKAAGLENIVYHEFVEARELMFVSALHLDKQFLEIEQALSFLLFYFQ